MSKNDNMNKKNSVTKYMMLYMSIGMCIGMAIGAAKDKRLSDKMMIIARIENLTGSSDIIIYTMDKNGEEKEYKVSRKKQRRKNLQ